MGCEQITLEVLEMTFFKDVYRGKRVLLTGHTGFKGSWLSLWLYKLGAHITGVSLPLHKDLSHLDLLNLQIDDRRFDIRDFEAVRSIVDKVKPEIIFHLAAQPLVFASYRDPLLTWETNLMGTANLLEACRVSPNVKAFVCVTTDKCYENRESPWGYRETDRLGGHDPYSASKASTELLVASYRAAFFESSVSSGASSRTLAATARAGNVIGGGDWGEERLIPDLVRAIATGRPLLLRAPRATRPWQHVLESLSGYLLLGQKLLEGEEHYARAWNFGPQFQDRVTVQEVMLRMKALWPIVNFALDTSIETKNHEAQLLHLDSTMAREKLGWNTVWDLDSTLSKTAEWYQDWLAVKDDSRSLQSLSTSLHQLTAYLEDAQEAKMIWAVK